MVMGGSYLLLAMMVLLVDERTLETGLDSAYISFNNSAASFLEKNTGLDSSGPASKLVIKFFIEGSFLDPSTHHITSHYYCGK